MLDDKVVLIAGGATGIGRGVAEAATAAGARVAVLDRNADALGTFGAGVVTTLGDATTLEANQRAVDDAVAAHGRIDALITIVGVWDYFTGLNDLPAEQLSGAFDELFAANVKSPLLAVKAALPALIASEGNVVLTVSNAGFYTAGGGALYTASKFAVRGLVHQLAYELAPKVRVNGVAPGGTPTPLSGLATLGQDGMHLQDIPDVDVLISSTSPLGVVPSPADHAHSYLFLASKAMTPAVTGTIIHSDGGLGIRGLTQPGGLTAPAPEPEAAAAG
jgi:2,3-dihydroxy-2,3-dihydrophenylpropionate dehydrogenase